MPQSDNHCIDIPCQFCDALSPEKICWRIEVIVSQFAMFSCVQTKVTKMAELAEAAEAESSLVSNTAMSNVFVSDRKATRSNGGGNGSTLRDGFSYNFSQRVSVQG